MIKYKVVPEKKMVVAYFYDYSMIPNEVWYRDLVDYEYGLKFPVYIDIERNVKKILETISSSDRCGIAKCSDGDEFDIEYGKELAKERLIKKFVRIQHRVTNLCLHDLNLQMRQLIERIDNRKKKLNK